MVEGEKVPQIYRDLLAHDQGSGIVEADYDERMPGGDLRTMALWGLRDHPGPFLTGRSASAIVEAIEKYVGSGAGARDLYRALIERDRTRLLVFLKNF